MDPGLIAFIGKAGGVSIAGLAVAVILFFMSWAARRLDRGSEQTMRDLRDLNERLETERDRVDERMQSERTTMAEQTHVLENRIARVRKERDLARQHARDLEYRLGVEHREWT